MSALKLELSSLLSLAKEAIVVWASDGRVVEWNEAAADMLGYRSQEILGQPITTVWPAASKQLTSINSRLRRGELLRNFQSQWNAKGGEIVDISLNMSAIFDDLGDASSTLCCAVDISYQRQLAMAERSELFLNAIISSAEDAIIATGADGRVRNWNPGAEQLFGYSRDEMIGNAISVLVPEHLSGQEAQILERILNGHRSENCETQRIRKDGRILGVLKKLENSGNLPNSPPTGPLLLRWYYFHLTFGTIDV
jgi:PAS domain S-box-containing protein